VFFSEHSVESAVNHFGLCLT